MPWNRASSERTVAPCGWCARAPCQNPPARCSRTASGWRTRSTNTRCLSRPGSARSGESCCKFLQWNAEHIVPQPSGDSPWYSTTSVAQSVILCAAILLSRFSAKRISYCRHRFGHHVYECIKNVISGCAPCCVLKGCTLLAKLLRS